MKKQGMHIVAMGAHTPIGLTAESSAAAVRGGISRLSAHPFLLDGSGESLIGALDPKLDPEIPAQNRMAPMVIAALQETISKLGREPAGLLHNSRLHVLLALPETRPGFSAEDAKTVVREIERARFALPTGASLHLEIEVVGRGHAGVLQGIEVATERQTHGTQQMLLVAGVDSYFDEDTIEWLDGNRQILRTGIRGGFLPGEAAGALALVNDQGKRLWAWPVLGTVGGIATDREDRLIRSDDEVLGEGLSRAIAGATNQLRLPEEAVDTVYGDLNGERYRTQEWGFAMMRTQPILRDSSCVSPADCWGDVGAASAALGVILSVQAWQRDYARGPRALVWASSESGLRGAAVVTDGKMEC